VVVTWEAYGVVVGSSNRFDGFLAGGEARPSQL